MKGILVIWYPSDMNLSLSFYFNDSELALIEMVERLLLTRVFRRKKTAWTRALERIERQACIGLITSRVLRGINGSRTCGLNSKIHRDVGNFTNYLPTNCHKFHHWSKSVRPSIKRKYVAGWRKCTLRNICLQYIFLHRMFSQLRKDLTSFVIGNNSFLYQRDDSF